MEKATGNNTSVDDFVSTEFKDRAKKGHPIEIDELVPTPEDSKKIKEELKDEMGYSDTIADEIAEAIVHNKRKFITVSKRLDGYSFFALETLSGGVTALVFNENHPLYNQLINTLNPEVSDETKEQLEERIRKASDTLKILFGAWARYELEDQEDQDKFFEFRQQWGRMSKEFLADRQVSFD